jgi:hypothetical protein
LRSGGALAANPATATARASASHALRLTSAQALDSAMRKLRFSSYAPARSSIACLPDGQLAVLRSPFVALERRAPARPPRSIVRRRSQLPLAGPDLRVLDRIFLVTLPPRRRPRHDRPTSGGASPFVPGAAQVTP